MIEIRNLTFAYSNDSQPALQDISLDIHQGEWLAVIGANGSGKSTLARQLNGLLLPSSGQVIVDGFDTADEASLLKARELVAFVFQNPDNQLIATSVEDDIAFGPENLGLSPEEITSRVENALSITGLTEKRYKAPHLLSGGEKQRVAIAGALAMVSRYLVLDEPTSMLDPGLRQSVQDTLSKLHQQWGMGIIYVTNIMEEALLADRIIVLDQGKLIKDGTPEEIFADNQWLSELGLAMPQICHLAARLVENGYAQAAGALDGEQLYQLLTKNNPTITGEPIPPFFPDRDKRQGRDMIVAEDVGFTYQPGSIFSCIALQAINLTIKKGEFVALIGHGGSGKSTMATLMAGLYKCTSGRIMIGGQSLENDTIFRKVGLVFQYPEQQLFGETIFEEVSFGAKNFGTPEDYLPVKVRNALLDVGLDPDQFWHRSPFTLSGGQKRRVCIAGILAIDPEVLILDEPSAGLDEGGRRWIMDLVRRLNAAGKTIIWISHNMSEVAELAQRLVVISEGMIIADGNPREVFMQREKLEQAGLAVPPVTELCEKLSASGWPLPRGIITVDEAFVAISGLLGGDGND